MMLKNEIERLLKRKLCTFVWTSEVPSDAYTLNSRFFLVIKGEETNKEIFEAIFLVQGHRDKMKKYLVHSYQWQDNILLKY